MFGATATKGCFGYWSCSRSMSWKWHRNNSYIIYSRSIRFNRIQWKHIKNENKNRRLSWFNRELRKNSNWYPKNIGRRCVPSTSSIFGVYGCIYSRGRRQYQWYELYRRIYEPSSWTNMEVISRKRKHTNTMIFVFGMNTDYSAQWKWLCPVNLYKLGCKCLFGITHGNLWSLHFLSYLRILSGWDNLI